MLSTIDILKEIRSVKIIIVMLRIQMGSLFVTLGLLRAFRYEWYWLSDTSPLMNFIHIINEVGFLGDLMGLFLIVTGLMLISQRLTTLGAILLLPIMFKILFRSFSIDLKEAMLLSSFIISNIFLFLLWDYERFTSLFDHEPSVDLK